MQLTGYRVSNDDKTCSDMVIREVVSNVLNCLLWNTSKSGLNPN